MYIFIYVHIYANIFQCSGLVGLSVKSVTPSKLHDGRSVFLSLFEGHSTELDEYG